MRIVLAMCRSIIALLVVSWLSSPVSASIVDGALDPLIDDSFNLIDDPANPSDGLLFFDLGLTVNLTQSEALAAAQAIIPSATVATAQQFADVFLAAGVSQAASTQLSLGFESGDFERLVSVDFPLSERLVFQSANGLNNTFGFSVFTDPDGSLDDDSTRDVATFTGGFAGVIEFRQDSALAFPSISHLIVVSPETSDPGGAIPEPLSLLVWAGLAGVFGVQARRRGRET